MRSRNLDACPGRFAAALLIAALAAGALHAQTAPPAPPPPPLALRLGQAVLMALTNNRALSVQRLEPEIRQTYEEQERAAFDPVVAASLARERSRRAIPTAGLADTFRGSLALSEFLPTGTRLGASFEAARAFDDDPEHASSAGITLTQALLQGRPVTVNLASLRQARLDTDVSAYELRGFAETLVAEVERAYWEGVLAQRRVEILDQSLALAERQLRDIAQRIKVGSLPETEEAAAQAEVALRQESLINARSGLATAQLRLLRLALPDALRGPRGALQLLTAPTPPDVPAEESADAHVAVALARRPDLNQARLLLQRGELELVKTRNGLLPRMDLFVSLGDTGYADSFGDATAELDGRELEWAAGVTLAWPLHNREARARHQRAGYSREQADEALRNLEDLARVDVASAMIEVARSRAQVAATATTRRFQEEKVRAETVKFGVGRSTALLVAAAQRDLVASQVSESEAGVRHLESLIDLYRLDGSLLERRGLTAPGRQPAGPDAP